MKRKPISRTWQPRKGNSKVVNDMEQYLGKALKQAMLQKRLEELDSEEEEEANNQELPATIVIDKYEMEMGKSIQKWQDMGRPTHSCKTRW